MNIKKLEELKSMKAEDFEFKSQVPYILEIKNKGIGQKKLYSKYEKDGDLESMFHIFYNGNMTIIYMIIAVIITVPIAITAVISFVLNKLFKQTKFYLFIIYPTAFIFEELFKIQVELQLHNLENYLMSEIEKEIIKSKLLKPIEYFVWEAFFK